MKNKTIKYKFKKKILLVNEPVFNKSFKNW